MRWRKLSALPPVWLWWPLAGVSAGGYVLMSRLAGYQGFPLDDAWIHQTYARNLVQLGQWAFVPGQPSAGSTSPLWTLLLAAGYVVRCDGWLWAVLLGTALLGLNAWLAYQLGMALWPNQAQSAVLAGLAVAVEWHLAWAAVSGMETLLFSALALAVFVWPLRSATAGRDSLLLGVVVSLSILTRPDGVTLVPFAVLRVAGFPVERRRQLGAFGLGLLLGVFPYLAFNQWVGGSWWPNTLAAKQAEYAVLRGTGWLQRLWTVGGQPLVGGLAVLIPGLAGSWLTRRSWRQIAPGLWAVGLALAYIWRLPVQYQHGRYLMPIIPVLIAVSLGGLWAELPRRFSPRWRWWITRIWAAVALAVFAAFWELGAQAYARDVAFIETEMVATAKWVAQHLPAEARLAAHDIGALGYYGQRPILDLAGLISPEVIPFVRDESRLKDWLNAHQAEYLITFPDWYPLLTAPLQGTELPTDNMHRPPLLGTTHMLVYPWPAILP